MFNNIYKNSISVVALQNATAIQYLSINIYTHTHTCHAEQEGDTILLRDVWHYILITYSISHFLKQAVHGKVVMYILLKKIKSL